MIIDDIVKLIEKSRLIGITYHTSPDGDSLGSALALHIGLRQKRINSYIISKDKAPESFYFLPYINEVQSTSANVQPNTDCVICLDCGNTERLNGNIELINRDYVLINIDHHVSNNLYGDLNYVDIKRAAVGEIIYDLLKRLDVVLDMDICTNLYTSILTDTGGFKHSNTTAVTHSIAGELVESGIQFSEIYRKIYENKRYSRIKLYGKIIEAMFLLYNNKLCVMELKKDILRTLNEEAGDTSDLISIGMEIDEVEVAALFKETDDGTKISLRSRSNIDVRKIAEFYGGGGHSKASGIHLDKPIEEAKEIIINHIKKELI